MESHHDPIKRLRHSLTASVLLFLLFLGIMFFVWYPAPYFAIDGGWTVLRILAGVDVVPGPLLTLIVFKPGLKSTFNESGAFGTLG